VRALFERETLDRAEVAEVFKSLKLWPRRPAWTGSDTRAPGLPPVTPPPSLNGHSNGYSNGHRPDGELPAGGAPVPPGHSPVPPALPGQPGQGVPGQPPQLPPGAGQPPAGGTTPPQGPGVTGTDDQWPPKGPDFR
jgi:cell division protease FtsH